ncbi:unnamed protein product [Rhizophagus irregularis]|nr:unnamed protein product [Rhizophagus irregularis]
MKIFDNYCSIFNNSTELFHLFHLIFSLLLINTNIIKIWNYQTVEGEIAHKLSEIELRDKNYSGFVFNILLDIHNIFSYFLTYHYPFRTLLVAYKTGCLMIGDKVKFEHKGKDMMQCLKP